MVSWVVYDSVGPPVTNLADLWFKGERGGEGRHGER